MATSRSTGSWVLLAAALLGACVTPALGCSCYPTWGSLCNVILRADLVLHVTVDSSTQGESINDDIIYTITTSEVFKGDPEAEGYSEGTTFDINMGGNGGLCGISLELGAEYVIDLYETGSDAEPEFRAVGLCGLTQEWSSVSTDDLSVLEEGCDDFDPCEESCEEHQECQQGYDSSDGYNCVDTCDPNPCQDGENCSLQFPTSCNSSSGQPCTVEAVCGSDDDHTGTPSPSLLWDSARTLPPGASIDSSAATGSNTLHPTPSPVSQGLGRDSARTLPPGNSIDSSSPAGSKPGSPSSISSQSLDENLTTVSSSAPTGVGSGGTPAPGNLGRDIVLTLSPGATIDSSGYSDGGSPAPVGGASGGTPAPGNLGRDVATTLAPGATVDSSGYTDGSSSAPTPSPTFSTDTISDSDRSIGSVTPAPSIPAAPVSNTPSDEAGTEAGNGASGGWVGAGGPACRAGLLAAGATAGLIGWGNVFDGWALLG